jgi:predicted O-linked N-acetylglucosamine transferase (SPINDLY family)
MEGGGPPPPELLPFATSAAIGGVAGATPSKTCAMEGGGPPPPGLSPFATPAAISDEVVFGSLSQRAKINQNVLRLWATLLMRVPASRLLLKDMALDDRTGRRNALDVLGAQGVTEDRVRFLDRAPTSAQHLAQYRLMDIALDPFPYNGTTTTCEALWMGLPVVVLAGRTHVSRVGVSLLTRIGLSELIAQTPEQYVEIAAELANDVPRLAELRSSLRDRMCQSPLMDGRRFAASVEAAYRRMWRSWCENGPAGAPESGSKGA